MEKLFIVVPVFNEEKEVVRSVVSKLLRQFQNVVVVNDGGDSLLINHLRGLSVHYLRHEINLGQGAALQTGTEYALVNGAEIIAHFDSDDQHSAEDLSGMMSFLLNNEADVILGSRFLKKEHRSKIPILRKIILKGAVVINFIFTGILLTDAHHGLRVFNRRAAEAVQLTENRQLHATEILWLLKKHHLKFKEYPAGVTYNSYTLRKGQKNAGSLHILKELILSKLIR